MPKKQKQKKLFDCDQNLNCSKNCLKKIHIAKKFFFGRKLIDFVDGIPFASKFS